MPSPTTIDEFLDLVRRSAVADEKRLAASIEKLRAAGAMPADPGQFAGGLVRDGVLTHFQAEQLLQGKWRRFSIGKYKVLERLGAGGMGSVYLCEHKLMRRRVALKVLPTAKAEDPAALERFYREARAVAALDHPNIVRAYDIDQEDKLHFLVMEHVDGSSLQEIIKKSGPMDVLRACHYIRQAALGLQHAHETAGLVHRDIKPGNLLVDRNGIVKVLDMGLARFFHDKDDVLTQKYDENVLGTADYLAPEQALDSHSVDIRADVYSLGATFYFCLTGRTPFAEGTVAQKLIWHQTRQPKPLRSLRPEVPEGVTAIIDKMMAKDASQRYQTPQQIADALAPWTQTPIPPPPDEEMPQFSPAAMGGSDTGSGARSGGSTELSPAPKKAWQVPSSTSSSHATEVRPAAAPAPVLPAAPQRKTAAPPAPAPAPAPVPRLAPSPPVVAPAPAPAAVNGASSRSQPQPSAPAPAATLPDSEVWDRLASDTAEPVDATDTAPSSRRGRTSGARRSGARKAPVSRKARWLLGGLAFAICAAVGVLLWLALRGGSPESSSHGNQGLPTIYVNKSRKDGAPSLNAALRMLYERSPAGGRIVLQEDIAEIVSRIDKPNITIEADQDRTITWKAPKQMPDRTSRLVLIYGAARFHLKGLTLDGDGRIDSLLDLSGYCPDALLEGLQLKGLQKNGLRIINCDGKSPDSRVQLVGLTITTTRPDQNGLYFEDQVSFHASGLANRNLVVRDLRCTGPGAKVRARAQDAVKDVDLPSDMPPVIGP